MEVILLRDILGLRRQCWTMRLVTASYTSIDYLEIWNASWLCELQRIQDKRMFGNFVCNCQRNSKNFCFYRAVH